jgi:hypothetical protein
MKVKNPNEVEILYSESSHYNSAYISGTFGGLNPSGMLEIDFFTDRLHRPDSTKHKIENGQISTEMEAEIERHLHVRKVEFTAMMNLEVAKAFHAWLTQKVADLEGFTNANPAK